VGFSLASSLKTRLVKRAVAAFTMVEIAISLGVIAIALVAILGVLPTGVRVQRDNREDTILNQEGVFWLEAIRSGSRGLDYLTNFVDTITISNVTVLQATTYYNPAGFVPAGAPSPNLRPALINGQIIVELLTYPKYTMEGRYTNRVTARVRAITGSAAEKGKSATAREFAFAYQVVSEVVPLIATAPQLLITNGVPPAELITRSNLFRLDLNRSLNFQELALTLQGPLIPKGSGYDVLGTPKRFRTLIGGANDALVTLTNNSPLVRPSIFVQAQ
jgi:type II secretory pathway pseudopilin PulG